MIRSFFSSTIFRKIRRLAPNNQRRLKRYICSQTHLSPIEKTDEGDVFIVGYPKTGNTWFQNLAAGVVYGIDPLYAPDTLIQSVIPDVHYKAYYHRLGTPMFFKTHHLPRKEYKRVVYLLRDGRDVMVSYFHFLEALRDEKIDFLTLIEESDQLPVGRWAKHVEAWMENPYSADMMIIRYEDLKRDAANELRRFCDFVGVERKNMLLKRVADHSSFEAMRSKEEKYGWANPRWPNNKRFMRRGKIGDFKNEMPEDVLNAFLQQSEVTLRKHSYL